MAEFQVGLDDNSPDRVLQKVAYDQGLHCLPIIHQCLDASTGSKMEPVQILGQV